MGDISALLANAASTNADFDLGKINKSYWEGQDQRAKNDLRDAFKGGVPLDASGQPDFGAMAKTLFQKGGLEQGVAASNLGIARDQLRFGQGQSADIGNFERGQPTQAQPIVGPSVNRNSVSIDPGKRADISAPQQSAAPPQGGAGPVATGPNSIVGIVGKGVPDELAGPIIQQVSAMARLDPNAPINDPAVLARVTQVAQAAIARSQGGQPQQPQAPQPQPPQAQPAPVTNAVTTTQAPQVPSRTDRAIAFYSGIMSDPRSPKQNVELAKERLSALQKNSELTPLQKEYSQAVLEGFKGTMQDFAADIETRKTAATEEAKLGAKKYESLVESGTKAQMEIPQLELLQEQMNDPNFFSGAGEKYNLLYKRLKSAVGIDPEAAVPQEYLRKATAANVLSSLGALKGLGQIRVAEINMAREAAASPENSVPANRLLVEISKRTHQRNADIAEMAQSYKEKNGTLDASFDKQVTAYYKKNPLFSDGEIKDWHKIIGQAKPQQAAGATQKFSSPADVHAAVASGKLKKGDSFQDSNGVTRFVP